MGGMNTQALLDEARKIWGSDKLSLEELLVHLGVVYGDLNRLARNRIDMGELDEAELKKELGNLVFSLIRWCDDLGYSHEECIDLAMQAQARYRERMVSGTNK